MPKNVFVSFDHEDAKEVGGFRSLLKNPDHPLDFHDHSLRVPVTDRSGRAVKYPPSDPRSERVREEIKSKFEKCSKLVVLVGENTWESEWVAWEVNTFFKMKQPLSGRNTWRRIRGMRLKDQGQSRVPPSLGGQSTECLNWDPEVLDNWIDVDPDA